MSSLRGKITIITGAGSGIGAATAMHFASLGAHLSLVDVDEDGLQESAAACRNLLTSENQVITVIGDLTADEFPEEVVKRTTDHFGQVDVLVNCAGVMKNGPESVSTAAFDYVLGVNLRATYRLSQAAVPQLKATKGCIVNVSSIATARILPEIVPYTISKGGVDQMTRAMALDLLQDKVRVNAVRPGFIRDTKIGRPKTPYEKPLSKLISSAAHVLNTVEYCAGTADLVAPPIAFLASEEARFVNGAILAVDGGSSLV